MYIFKLNVLIRASKDENIELESEISEKLGTILEDKEADFISTFSETLAGDNYGQCSICGCWVSNYKEKDYITAFSNGVKIEKRWYCDLCLPEDHPVSF